MDGSSAWGMKTKLVVASILVPAFISAVSPGCVSIGDHVCDGLAQCPRHDDELLCNSLCPQGCVCQGLAFVCGQPFDDRRFSHLATSTAEVLECGPQTWRACSTWYTSPCLHVAFEGYD